MSTDTLIDKAIFSSWIAGDDDTRLLLSRLGLTTKYQVYFEENERKKKYRCKYPDDCDYPDCGTRITGGIKCNGEFQASLYKGEALKHPLSYCTYIDNYGKRKFYTDFIPQVIAAYEMNIQKYQDGKWAGAVYKAMEDALNKFFLTRIEDGA